MDLLRYEKREETHSDLPVDVNYHYTNSRRVVSNKRDTEMLNNT